MTSVGHDIAAVTVHDVSTPKYHATYKNDIPPSQFKLTLCHAK